MIRRAEPPGTIALRETDDTFGTLCVGDVVASTLQVYYSEEAAC